MEYATENITAEELETRLTERVRAGDTRHFVALVEATDWTTQQPEALTTAIDLALHLDMSRLAVKLAEMGGRLFPDHERVQQAARVLAAPAKTRISKRRPIKGKRASMDWFQKHATEYRGQWVAVRDGQLVQSAQSFETLIETIGRDNDLLDTIITRVL